MPCYRASTMMLAGTCCRNACPSRGVLSVTRARDQAGRLFVRLAQGFTGVYTLTAHLEAFADWYAFYAAGGSWERGDGRWDGSLPAPNAYLLLRGCLFVHYERLSTKGR